MHTTGSFLIVADQIAFDQPDLWLSPGFHSQIDSGYQVFVSKLENLGTFTFNKLN